MAQYVTKTNMPYTVLSSAGGMGLYILEPTLKLTQMLLFGGKTFFLPRL
jgi:hypothetical protein